jgi:hypothetical protein
MISAYSEEKVKHSQLVCSSRNKAAASKGQVILTPRCFTQKFEWAMKDLLKKTCLKIFSGLLPNLTF